ncbi:phenylacetate--CoA ligase family protein [Halomicrobium sp. IBSBa]|uniref:phenylacetate--CoA ligase family protein n=1 Tax=Halomicrobium sp. IBSBa TaxID=2778916 RepID=UPI001FCA126D|nr:AMP-binding protein [Halomicrobium sp. IBSBa]
MSEATDMWNPLFETMDSEELRAYQLERFRDVVRHVKEHSPFYAEKFSDVDPDAITSLADVRELPLTTKAELRKAQAGEDLYGEVLTADRESIVSYHQTSGTTGQPVRQADSMADWEWWIDCWATVLWANGVRAEDRVFFPFSYNVFLAFWAAHDAAERIGAEVVPGGGMSSSQRVQKIEELEPTVVATTPTYAFRLAEVADEEGIDLAASSVETVICAGEPGASVSSTKAEIERLWGADVYDHAGATEAGAWGFSCEGTDLGLHLNEKQFLIEVLDENDEPVEPGEVGRVVVTPLHRFAQPYVRFDLKDRVRLTERGACECGRTFRLTDGGVLGRDDDFKTINGMLFTPRAAEDIVHGYDDVTNEFRVRIDDHPTKELEVLELAVEADTEDTDAIESEVRKRMRQQANINPAVKVLEPGELTRNELKSDRVVDNRSRKNELEA